MLHGMHEGVLILSNRSSISDVQKITFCNQPAGKLINQITRKVGNVPNLNFAVLSHDCFELVQPENGALKGLIHIRPRSIDQIVMA